MKIIISLKDILKIIGKIISGELLIIVDLSYPFQLIRKIFKKDAECKNCTNYVK